MEMRRKNTPRERSKRSSRQLIAATLLLYPAITQAAPVGGQVVSGAGSMSQSGSTTTITQSSQNLSLNWKSFNVAPKETVNFVQPSASAIAVNRIFDTNGTQILGHLNANGQVYLVNPNGILFGTGAQVNVGGLIASTLDLNDASLNSNVRSFSGNGTGSVINQGTITAVNGGYVALLGNTVRNPGTIIAQLGSVALGAGSAVTLTFGGNSLVSMQVDQSTLNNLAENGGLIQADGGMVIMSAGAKDALLASVVNNTGVIDARTVENHDGTITLLGGMAAGQTNVSGTLDASAPNGGNGGFIETSAAHVNISNSAQITTAAPMGLTSTWLIDPQDFTVAASGGDITGSTLATELANTSIQLQSSTGGIGGSGNVNINDAVSWSANTILTLTASNNVNVNANITAAGNAAGLVIAPNTANGNETASGSGVFNLNNGAAITLSGSTPSLSIAGNAYTVINSLGAASDATSAPVTPGLQGIAASNLSGYYALGSNIDATATSGWNSNAGFTPIGSVAAPFTGTFDGLGHTIGTLTVNLPATADIGLFGSAGTASTIRDVGLVGGSVIGSSSAGALVGSNTGTVSNTYATGSVGGGSSMGGLLGSNTGTVSNSHATGNVSGTSSLGGLMGSSTGAVSNSYATGSVSGTSTVGGLMGSSTGPVSNSYAAGSVSGTSTVGGLMGSSTGPVSNSYATGNVVGTTTVGGLIGSNTGLVSNTYATGNVSGTGTVGGLMGSNTAVVSDSYWNSVASGQTTSAGGLDMTSAAMMQSSSFSSWDLATTWIVYDGLTNPLLRSFMTPVVVTANNASKTYDGLAYSGGNGVTYSTAPTGNLLGSVSYGGSTSTSQGAISAGGYVIAPSGLYSNQQGYVISFANGTLTINQAALTATANAASKTYDGQTYAGGNGVSYSGFVNNETSAVLGGSLSYVGTSQGAANAGSYLITPQGLTSGNYALSFANGALTVNQAALTATANAASKTYDGQAYSGGNSVTYSGFVNNETSAVLGGSLSYAGTSQGATNAGSYFITPQGLTSGNYALSFANGALTVNQAALTAAANAASKTYDGQAYSGGNGVSYSGFVNNETSAVLGGSLSYVGTSQGAINAGSYLITPQGLTSGNYTVSYANGALTINQAALIATANAASKTYDGQTYAGGNGVSYSGFVNNETSAVLGGSLSYTGTSQGATNAGSYLITPQGLTSGNYALSFANGALTINQAALTVTPAAPTINQATPTAAVDATSTTYVAQTYSGSNAVSYIGLVNSEASAVLTGAMPRRSNSDMVAEDGSSSLCLLRIVAGGMRLPNDTAGAQEQDPPCNISLRDR
jgi:filamentous hemagglutinin family protein